MNIREIVTNVGIACLVFMAFNYFFPSRKGVEVESNVTFSVSKDGKNQRALYTEIDFEGAKRPQESLLSEVETDWGYLVFSTEGGALESLEYKRMLNESKQPLRTVFPKNDADRDQRCLIVGFDEETPYFYTLIDQVESDEATTIVYGAKNSQVEVIKTFVIDKTICKIDMNLEVTPINGSVITPRILFSAPVLPELGDQEVSSGIFFTRESVFEKIERSQLPENKGWLQPTLFGVEDRYFVHALIKDGNQFAQRAFYGLKGKTVLSAVIEGPAVDTAHSWNMSFYFGPKDSETIDPVDIRLEKTLDYSGILAPLSKALLRLLKWLHEYVHNFGLAIILLICLINILLLPISLKGKARMKEQQEMQKKLAILQQRYKNDPERLNFERMELVKKHGMPGIGGCLPLLLQMPLFFAFSRVLGNSVALYQAPFLWITDLSAADPYYVLPFLVMVTMLLNALSVDAQQRVSMVVMALVFGAITAKLSAGLALYFVFNTLWGVLQARVVSFAKS